MVAANPYLRLSYRDPHPMVRSGRVTSVLDFRPPLTAEDLRSHAWINERLAALHQERPVGEAAVARIFPQKTLPQPAPSRLEPSAQGAPPLLSRRNRPARRTVDAGTQYETTGTYDPRASLPNRNRRSFAHGPCRSR